MKKLLVIVGLVVVAYFGLVQNGGLLPIGDAGGGNRESAILANAFENRTSDIQVKGQGVVIKVLSDDSDGSRHQRFIIRLDSGQTLLVAHNIDLAPRVASLREGDQVIFSGEYEWNSKGGVIHWTHHDPNGRHATGWIKHNGKTYQ